MSREIKEAIFWGIFLLAVLAFIDFMAVVTQRLTLLQAIGANVMSIGIVVLLLLGIWWVEK